MGLVQRTERLLLRPLRLGDAPDVERLAGDWEIAKSTLRIPHPYPPEAALDFIMEQETLFADGQGIAFAIADARDKELFGCIGLGYDAQNFRAELGYWLGVPYWGRGYATEAARKVVDFGFRHFRLNRIYSRHFAFNPASGRVLEKIGLQREGYRREAYYKEGLGFLDVVEYAILRREWQRARG